jgi:uncharacterized Ntn-hydrolase superfamily protein
MTYSIVGADSEARQVGGAGTSCLEGDDVYVIYRGVPGHGVAHAQAHYSLTARNRAAELLAMDRPPADIIRELTLVSFDRDSAIRQYGLIDVQGRSAGFTGSGTGVFAGDRQGRSGSFAYSVQGNILTSEQVLSRVETAFTEGGCDLAERLMRALEAGAGSGEGDSRCTPNGIPSDSAFLQVEREGGATGDYLSLRVRSSGQQNPLPELRAQLDAWRVNHPCPTPPAGTEGMQPTGPTGCGCRIRASDDWLGAPALLLGCLLVVARRRQRASRQLSPAHAA